MPSQQSPQSQSSGYVSAPWLVAFGVLSGVLLLGAGSPKYGEVAAALAVLIAAGAWTANYAAIRSEINALAGTNY